MSGRYARIVGFVMLGFVLFFSETRAQAAWRSTFGATSQSYQAWVTKVVSEDYRITYVNGYDVGGSPRFAALAVKGAKAIPWETRHDLSAEAYQTTFDDLKSKGYRLTCASGYLSGSAPRFAAVWVKDRMKGLWAARHNLTEKDYHDMVEREGKRGHMLVMVTGYADGAGSYRFQALFVPAARRAWIERHDLTSAQYQKTFAEWRPKSYRPISVSAYPTPAGVRFAVVLLKDEGTDWSAAHGLTAEQYQEQFDKLSQRGFRPVSLAGYSEGAVTNADAFDTVMRKFMEERHIQAGSLAVARDGKLLISKGYGYADLAGQRRVEADDPFRIASLTKAITAAAVGKLVADGKLSLDTRVFPLLGLKPPLGKVPDARLHEITVRHLLDHKGGWDLATTLDPMFRPVEIAAALNGPAPAGPVDIIRFMMGEPLQFDPGSRVRYSNFGYCVLGRVIEKASGQTYVDYVQKAVLAPLGIKTVELGRSLPRFRNPREPVYIDPGRGRNVVEAQSQAEVPAPDGNFYLEAMDSHGGLIASSRDLVRFLDAYWGSGERRQGNGRSYVLFGSLPGTFTMMIQRPNGLNIAALFNQRSDPSSLGYMKLRDMMQTAADGQSGPVHYVVAWVKE